MKRSRFSEEQIVYAIRQAEAGTPIGDLCRQLGVSEATFYTWKKQYAHLGVSELRRLRQVEEENALLADSIIVPQLCRILWRSPVVHHALERLKATDMPSRRRSGQS